MLPPERLLCLLLIKGMNFWSEIIEWSESAIKMGFEFELLLAYYLLNTYSYKLLIPFGSCEPCETYFSRRLTLLWLEEL